MHQEKFSAVTGADTIRIDSTIDPHQFRISTGYRGPATRAERLPEPKPRGKAAAVAPARRARTSVFMASGGGCPCCAS
jgi:hypothetical protein